MFRGTIAIYVEESSRALCYLSGNESRAIVVAQRKEGVYCISHFVLCKNSHIRFVNNAASSLVGKVVSIRTSQSFGRGSSLT